MDKLSKEHSKRKLLRILVVPRNSYYYNRREKKNQHYLVENKVDTSKWREGFPKDSNVKPSVESSITYHYEKHGPEMGAQSVE